MKRIVIEVEHKNFPWAERDQVRESRGVKRE